MIYEPTFQWPKIGSFASSEPQDPAEDTMTKKEFINHMLECGRSDEEIANEVRLIY